jgi:hypothetical protein
MRTSITCVALLLAAGSAGAAFAADRPSARDVAGEYSLGINLAGPADWDTELPFTDAVKTSRRWISQRDGAAWGQGPKLELTDDGYPARLAPDAYATSPMLTFPGHKPEGVYTLLYEGTGELDFFNNARVVDQEPGRIEFEMDPDGGGFMIHIRATDPDDPIRGMQVLLPDFEPGDELPLFRPEFLERWEPMSAVRFMDWMHTNNSTIESWDDRPEVDDRTWSPHGIPLEVMIDYANQTGLDPWFCMPHLADDEYVRNFAEMVKEELDEERVVYVEFSNELWNGQFAQSRWAGETGMEMGLAEKPWEAGWKYTAIRSVEIFEIWYDVFGDEAETRVVRVLPSQAANPFVARQILRTEVNGKPAGEQADALAIAPYVSLNVPPTGGSPERPSADMMADWGPEEVIEHLLEVSMPQTVAHMRGNREVADQYGLALIAYEAGQHAVGVRGGENVDELTELLIEANRHPDMADVYEAYYDAWQDAGGGLMAVFASVGRYSKWGSWGLLEYHDQTEDDSGKYRVTMERAYELAGE